MTFPLSGHGSAKVAIHGYAGIGPYPPTGACGPYPPTVAAP